MQAMSIKSSLIILFSIASVALPTQAANLSTAEIQQYEICAPKALKLKSNLQAQSESIRVKSNSDYRDLKDSGVPALDGWNAFLYTAALNRVISRTRKLDYALEHLEAGESLHKTHKRAIIRVCAHNWHVWSYVTE